MSQVELIRPKNSDKLDISSWEHWVRENLSIDQYARHAAILIDRIRQGVRHATNMIQAESGNLFVQPELYFEPRHPMFKGSLASLIGEKRIIAIGVHTLSQLSTLSLNELHIQQHHTREIIFEGLSSDYAFLCGVEEADHAWFIDEHGLKLYGNPLHMSLAEYDATAIEFRSLQRRKIVAQSLNMPVITQEVLAKRLEAAQLFAREKDEDHL